MTLHPDKLEAHPDNLRRIVPKVAIARFFFLCACASKQIVGELLWVFH